MPPHGAWPAIESDHNLPRDKLAAQIARGAFRQEHFIARGEGDSGDEAAPVFTANWAGGVHPVNRGKRVRG
eukprot:3785223-Lingulodinium_polyedra.AAC.1